MTLWLLWSTVWLRHSIGLFVSQIAMPYYCNLNLSHVIGRCCHLSQSNTRDICHIPCLRRKQQLHGPEEVAVVSASLKDAETATPAATANGQRCLNAGPAFPMLFQQCWITAPHWRNAGPMLGQRLRRCPSIGPALDQCPLLAVIACKYSIAEAAITRSISQRRPSACVGLLSVNKLGMNESGQGLFESGISGGGGGSGGRQTTLMT